MHNRIKIENFSLSFLNKICFEDFSTEVNFGDRIAIVGRNGSGKSSLLKMIATQNQTLPLAYVPQIIEELDLLSGGERFNKVLSAALGKNPSILLLDEPTNHLDSDNRKSLMRMLNAYYGTLIVATHDEELLQRFDILWHIDNGKITVFHGKYTDYLREQQARRQSISHQIHLLETEKRLMHEKLMQEEQRAAKSRAAGKKKIVEKKRMKIVADAKAMQAEKSQGKNAKYLASKKQQLTEQLSELHLAEAITPKFYLPFSDAGNKTIVSVADGAVRYLTDDKIVASNIHLSIMSHEHVALLGKNGSGKTTLLRAIMNDPHIIKTGAWHAPKPSEIGYLDQHYGNLDPEKSAIEIIQAVNPAWTHAEIRKHLNDFLFRKNEEVNCLVKNLSGGEKARLSLAQIAAKVPKLLILDEITNNIDLETKQHVAEILREYPAAMLIVSHDQLFLDKIRIDKWFNF